MAGFTMCEECRAEYENPADRRFHAQPNACPACGPALSAPIAEAQRRLADGEILAIKGLGGFHLACDARNSAAVGRLRARKRRSDKPFAVMVGSLEAAREICVVDDAAARALTGPRHPIVILPRLDVAQALLPAASRLVSTPVRGRGTVSKASVGMSADAAGKSACATSRHPNTREECPLSRAEGPPPGHRQTRSGRRAPVETPVGGFRHRQVLGAQQLRV
jgi:hypothetical protein